MSEEIPAVPPVAEPGPVPPARSRAGGLAVRRLLIRLARWLGELCTVFVGVYAAFFLNNQASHRHDRQRREQLLTWVEERYTSVLGNAREGSTKLRDIIRDFDGKLAAGQMPEVKPVSWRGDYDASDSLSVLQSGGYDLLEIDTIRDIREVESTLRQLVSAARHAQDLSDALILPNRGKDPAIFYDPATRQLREPYAWVPQVRHDFAESFDELQSQCVKLLAQVRADRQHGR